MLVRAKEIKTKDGRVITADQIKKYIFYPLPEGARIEFDADGTADWPDDSFTRRRLNEGCIAIVDEKAEIQARQKMLEKQAQYNLDHHFPPEPEHQPSQRQMRMQTAPTPRAPSLAKPALETKGS